MIKIESFDRLKNGVDFLPNCTSVCDGGNWIYKYSINKVRKLLDMKICIKLNSVRSFTGMDRNGPDYRNGLPEWTFICVLEDFSFGF